VVNQVKERSEAAQRDALNQKKQKKVTLGSEKNTVKSVVVLLNKHISTP